MRKEKLKMQSIILKKVLKMLDKVLKKQQDMRDLPFNKQIKILPKDCKKLNKLHQTLMKIVNRI